MVRDRRRRHLRALTLGVALALVGPSATMGCASSAPRPKPRTSAYLRVVEERVAAASDVTQLTLRHNPSACDCPPFEVLLGETWQRAELVEVDADDPIIQAIEASLEERPDAELTIEGRVDGDLFTCGRGMLYVSLVPSAFVAASSSDAR